MISIPLLLFLVFFYALLIIGLLYSALIASIFLLYNPMLIGIMLLIIYKIGKTIMIFFVSMQEKEKIKLIKSFIGSGQNSFNIGWEIGKNGLWIEAHIKS
jgi:hypothetical protein